jgi:autotransporter-associated beta strand protein
MFYQLTNNQRQFWAARNRLPGWLLLWAVIFLCASAWGTALLYEPFPSSYGNGTVLRNGNSSTVWVGGNSTGPGSAIITNTAAMTYSTLTTSTNPDTSYGILFAGTPGSARNAVAQFSPTAIVPGSNTPAVYCSFLINVQAAPASMNLVAYLRSDTSAGSPAGLAIWLDSSSSLYISRATTATPTATPVALSPGVNLIVARYHWIDGVNDRAELWVNPVAANLGVGEVSIPPPNAYSMQGSVAGSTGFKSLELPRYSSASGGAAAASGTEFIDEIRVGTNWADVTPSSSCTTASLTASPSAQTAFAGGTAVFNCAAAGSTPAYQWQASLDAGATWNPVAGGTGAATANYTTPILALTNNGTLYRCIATVPCDYSSVTSAVAGLTVIDPATIRYRSAGSGSWTNLATWQQSPDNLTWNPALAVPFFGNPGITIQSGHTVTVNAAATADNLAVQAGGTLLIGGGTLTLYAAAAVDADIYGSLVIASNTGSALAFSGAPVLQFESGGQFVWGQGSVPAIPAATWRDGSTCSITNCATSGTVKPSGLGQNFANFTWDWAAQANTVDFAGTLTNVRGNFHLNTGRTVALADGSPANSTLNIGGDLTVAGPTAASSKLNFVSGTAAALQTVNLGGNLSVTSVGTGLDCTDPNALVYINFTNAGNQSLTITSPNLAATTRSQWSVAAGSVLTLNSPLPLAVAANSTASMNVNGTLNLNGHSLSPPVLTGTGLITNSTGTATLTVGGIAPATNCVYSGLLADGGNLINLAKTGNNTFALAGSTPNLYGGATTVSGGTLDVQMDGGLGSGSVAVAVGATLKLELGSANNYLNDSASLLLNPNASVNLAYTGTDAVQALSFDGGATFQAAGTWGAAGSGAQFTDARFAGAGLLNVLTGGAVSPPCSATNQVVGIAYNANNTFTVTFLGTPQAQYFVQAHTNLAAADWAAVAGSTNTAGAGGQWQFTATNAATLQFFRAAAVNPCP